MIIELQRSMFDSKLFLTTAFKYFKYLENVRCTLLTV
jgi:hypothetical protein